jgi:hypothetical protein
VSSSHLTQGRQLLKQARALLNQVQENIRKQSFISDDVCMEAYNDLTAAAASLFAQDPILNGQMVILPDAVLKSRSWADMMKSPEVPSQRTEQHLIRLINRLEILLGEEPTHQLLDERDFSFLTDPKLQQVLRLDFIDAQKSFAVGVYKACGLLCGSLIEGMLLDIIQRPNVVSKEQLDAVAKKLQLPRRDQSIDWDKVSMTNLISMSSELGLVDSRALRFAEGARDTRDTVHPRAEVRQGSRVSREEASILLELVKLIYNNLVARFS